MEKISELFTIQRLHNTSLSFSRLLTFSCLPLSLCEQTRIQTAPWMTGTVTTVVRPVTASRLPTTPPPSPMLPCTNTPWGTRTTDTPTTTKSMSWTTTTEPWGNKAPCSHHLAAAETKWFLFHEIAMAGCQNVTATGRKALFWWDGKRKRPKELNCLMLKISKLSI